MSTRFIVFGAAGLAFLCWVAHGASAVVDYWSFDNAGDLGLNQVTGLSLSANGDAQYDPAGHSGGALLLDGSGDYLSGTTLVPMGNSPYTISAWIRPDVAGDRGIVGWGNYGTTRQVNAFRLIGANDFRHYWWGADIDRSATVAGVNLLDGNYHHVLATYNGATRALYVDGKPIGSDLPGANNAQPINFRIGSTNNGEYFDGRIDDVAIWSEGLAPNQVRALAAGASPYALPAAGTLRAQWVADDYAGGNWVDRVASLPAIVDNGAPTALGGQLNGHAVVRFNTADGNDAFRVDAGNNPLASAGDFTLATVFRTSTLGAGNPADGWWTNTGLVDMEMPGRVRDWGLVFNNQGGVGAGLGGNDVPSTITLPSVQTGLNNGQAHVAVYTRQGGTVTLYVDGVAIAQTNNGAGLTLERLVNRFTIGKIQTNANWYNGDMAEIQIHDARLPAVDAQLLTMSLARTYGFAGTATWVGGAGPWETGGNWQSGSVPTPLDDATIDNGGTAQLSAATGTATAGSLAIGNTVGGTLAWTGGNLNTWDIRIGNGGTLDRSGNLAHWAYGGKLTLSGNGRVLMPAATYELQLNDGASMALGGTASASNFHAVIVGNAGDANTLQTVTVADSAQMTGINYIVVGKSGHKGAVVQTGGAVGVNNLFLGEFTASEGHYQMGGGTLNVAALFLLGKEGIGTMTQTSGAVTVTAGGDSTHIGDAVGSVGSYMMSGGTLSTSNLQVGWNGIGELVAGGNAQVNVGGWFVAGRQASGQGRITLRDSASATATSGTIVGELGVGELNIQGAATLTAPVLHVGLSNGIDAAVYQSGGTVNIADTVHVRSDGAYNQSGGVVNANRTLTYGTAGNPSELALSGNARYNNTTYISIGTTPGDEGVLRVRDNAQLLVGTDFNVSDQTNSRGALYLDGGLVRGNVVFIGKAGGTVGRVFQTGGELRSNNYFNIGTAGASAGEYHISGGLAYATSDFNVSDQANSTGTLYLDGGAVSGNILYIGKSSGTVGTVIQTGGTMTARAGGDTTLIASAAGSTGSYQMTGGSLNTSNLQVGFHGTGALVAGGNAQVNVGGWFVAGRWADGQGAITLRDSAAATATANGTIVGELGPGTLNVQNSALLRTNAMFLGLGAGGSGTVNQSGGLIVVNGNPQVGVASTGTLNQTGGIFYHVNHMAVGRSNGGNGAYDLSAAGINAGRWIIVAEDAGATGNMTIGGLATLSLGGASVSPASLEVARNGTGTVTQTGGNVNADSIMLASGSGTGVYNLQGGNLATRSLVKGPGTGTFNFTGGTLSPGAVGFSLVNNGGGLYPSTPPRPGFDTRWYSGNVMTDDPGNWNPATPAAFTQVVDAVAWGGGAPPGGLPGDYFGTVYRGMFFLPATMNVSFRERVDDSAVLYIDGVKVLEDTQTHPANPAVNPWDNHTFATVSLAGGWHALEFRYSDHVGGQNAFLEWDPAGAQGWSLLVGGAVFADLGSDYGTTVINGSYTQNAGFLDIDINRATGQADKLSILGALSAGGELQIDLAAGLPDYGVVFDILDFTSASGQFNVVSDPDFPLPPAVYWNTSRLYLTGEIWLAVPEPATWALAALSALLVSAAAMARRRRRGKAGPS